MERRNASCCCCCSSKDDDDDDDGRPSSSAVVAEVTTPLSLVFAILVEGGPFSTIPPNLDLRHCIPPPTGNPHEKIVTRRRRLGRHHGIGSGGRCSVICTSSKWRGWWVIIDGWIGRWSSSGRKSRRSCSANDIIVASSFFILPRCNNAITSQWTSEDKHCSVGSNVELICKQ